MHRRLHYVLPIGGLVFCGLLRLACGCSSNSAALGSDDGSPDGRSSPFDASGTNDRDSGGSTSSLDGWVPYTDYNPSCNFLVPAAPNANPSPISWQTCDSSAQPGGISCRQMTTDWTYPSTGGSPGVALHGAVQPNGSVLLLVERATGTSITNLVAEADGPVHFSIFQPTSTPCALVPDDITETKYVYQVLDSFSKGQVTEKGGGAIGGDSNQPKPSFLMQFDDGPHAVPHQLSAGIPGVIDDPIPESINLYDWSTLDASTYQPLWTPAQENGLQLVNARYLGTTLFFEATGGSYCKEKVLPEAGSVQDFISYGTATDFTHAAGDLGTDGTDIVWIEGSGVADAGLYPTVSIYTAPYTSNPETIMGLKRRLRSEIANGVCGSPFVVGCGYAVRSAGGTGLRIVRMSDGVSWLLPATGDAHAWDWEEPVVVTCAELFASVNIPNPTPHLGLARVRLDSLGMGTPPD